MRFFKKKSGRGGGSVPDRAGASRGQAQGPSWTGYGEEGTGNPWTDGPNYSTQSKPAEHTSSNWTTLMEKRAFDHPMAVETRARVSAAKEKASEGAARSAENAARAKSIRETSGGFGNYNPYAASDTGHI